MISKYDLIKEFDTAKQKGQKLSMMLSDDKASVLDSDTGEYICKLDTLLQVVREKNHCDFETIYCEHATLTDVYRCRQCGTVIFGGDDEDHYNPKEKCPTCCNDPSVTWNEYWTKEEIDSDPKKQETIKQMIEMQAASGRYYERRKARNGLNDWERWKKSYKTQKYQYDIVYLIFGFDGDLNRVPEGLKASKYLEIHKWSRADGMLQKGWKIPLNCYAFYHKFIYPYTKKCHKDFRKYAFWQKKEKTDD